MAHPPPASAARAHAATRDRSILELWRRSTGSSGTSNTATTSRSDCTTNRVDHVEFGQSGRTGRRIRLDHGDDLLEPRRPDPHDSGQLRHRRSIRSPARSDRSDHTARASRSGGRSARRSRAGRAGRDDRRRPVECQPGGCEAAKSVCHEPVVAGRRVRRPHDHLAEHAGLIGEIPACLSERVERADPHLDAIERVRRRTPRRRSWQPRSRSG